MATGAIMTQLKQFSGMGPFTGAAPCHPMSFEETPWLHHEVHPQKLPFSPCPLSGSHLVTPRYKFQHPQTALSNVHQCDSPCAGASALLTCSLALQPPMSCSRWADMMSFPAILKPCGT